jgi:hypothetical protein
VENLKRDDQSVTAEVVGSNVYEVEIRHDSRYLRGWCSCPYFADRSAGCKHLWATAVLAVEHGWLTNLPGSLDVVMDFAGGEELEFGVFDDDEVEVTTPAPWIPGAPLDVEAPDWQRALAAVTYTAGDLPSPADEDSQLLYV